MREPQKVERLVPDTSVIVEGLVSARICQGELEVGGILIHEGVVAELEHQANQNKAAGFLGLDELERLRVLSTQLKFSVEFMGKKPSFAELRHSALGDIDALIRDLAFEQDGTLFTADKIQSRIAQAKGIRTIFVKAAQSAKSIELDTFFDDTTMSVHLRENVPPMAKKGVPGNWQFTKIKDAALERGEIQDISREIIEEAGMRADGFVEIERPGSTIVQLGRLRIVITKPPFSDGWEITAVRPVRKLALEDYHLSAKLMERITQQADGILIAGSPGMGKSTFAQALAEFYAAQGSIVKTIEAPRDMVLPDTITQYSLAQGDPEEIHDVLLLSRPDHALFDEMRNTKDFMLFADLRLAGIGLAGVVHAKNPIDAIQRFVGRIELGVIPQVIDTVIFIQNGAVAGVLSLQMTVKVPSGMTEADLARPVVVVTDFETRKLLYELYTYGEETVVVPVKEGGSKAPVHTLAARSIEQAISQHVSSVRAEMNSDTQATLHVPAAEIGTIIGKDGEKIKSLEQQLGMHLEVRAEKERVAGEPIPYDATIGKKHVIFQVQRDYVNKMVAIAHDGDFLVNTLVGKDGIIKVSKNNKIGKIIEQALHNKENLTLSLPLPK